MTAWPAEAVVTASWSRRRSPDVERTTAGEDVGPVRQARISVAGGYVLQVEARIAASDYAGVRAWALAHAWRRFDMEDPRDGVTRAVRVIGGFGGIRWDLQRVKLGPPPWGMSCQLEGAL